MKVAIVGLAKDTDFSTPFSPWSSFAAALVDRGITFTLEMESDVRGLVAMNHNADALQVAALSGVPLSRRVLVLWEPIVVRPDQFKSEVFSQYGVRMAPSPIWAKHVKGECFKWPQNLEWLVTDPNTRSTEAIILQGNKMSAVSGELYSLRRRVAHLDERVIVAGQGWPSTLAGDCVIAAKALRHSVHYGYRPRPSRLLEALTNRPRRQTGPIHSKVELLSRYQVAIVIENSRDYVSEKLFDAMAARCSIVYVGPRLQDFEIPPRVCIEAEPNPAAVSTAVSEALSEEARQDQLAARSQLMSTNAEEFRSSNVLANLGDRLSVVLKRHAS